MSFLFSSLLDHRDPHSFPTRRSSDLSLADYATVLRESDTLWLSFLYSLTFGGFVGLASFLTTFFHEQNAVRSEEHTSELQSLAYLVCRLLLEKKKTNRSNHSHVSHYI